MKQLVSVNSFYLATVVIICAGSSMSSAQAYTSAQVQAKILLEKMSGTKISMDQALIAPMAAKIAAGDLLGAAMLAESHPGFLNVTVKNMALQMSTREETIRLPLNDFAASFIGVTRDGGDARTLLTGNFTYVGNPSRYPAGVTIPSDPANDMADSNNHYQALDTPQPMSNGSFVSLDLGSILTMSSGQPMTSADASSTTTPVLLMNPDPAGVLTSRSFLMAHTVAGTNRRAVEFSFREFMCAPITNWADIQASDQRIGRDVDRFPGNNNTTFLTTCKGCHSQLDAFRGSFARFDADGGGNHVGYGTLNNGGDFDGNGIASKMNKNNTTFPNGFVTVDTSFINNAQGPTNQAQFGWSSAAGGSGVGQFGAVLAGSQRFPACMAMRVFQAVCRRSIDITGNASYLAPLAQDFMNNNYNLQRLFAKVAITSQCTQ